MKKTIKILLISIFTIVLIQTIVLAAGSIDTNIRIGTTPEISANKQMTSRILSYLQLVGSIGSIVALAIIGIRYMLSSVDEQAKMKGILGYYVVGAFLVFATSNVIGILYDIIYSVSF